MRDFFWWFQGYLCISFYGEQLVRFLNLCRNHGIRIRKVKKDTGWILISDFRKLRGIVKKTKTRIHIRQKRGLPFFLFRLRRHPSIVVAFFLFGGILLFLSLFIWDISVGGGRKYTEERILKYLKEQGIENGCFKSEIDCEKIEEQMRLDFPDIGWVSASLSGTRLHIELVEIRMPKRYETAEYPSHLIAPCDGTVSFIMTRTGTPRVTENTRVKKGDILVEGIIPLYGEGGTVTTCEGISADADIGLDTWITYEKCYDRRKKVRSYTGRQRKRYGLSFQDSFCFFPYFGPDYERKEVFKEEKKLFLTEQFCLPVRLICETQREYCEKWEKMTKEEARKEGNLRLQTYFQKLEEKGVSILKKRVTIEVMKSQYRISGRFLVREKVEKRRKVTERELNSRLGMAANEGNN